MAVMLPRMISAGSLSAFSASLAATLPSTKGGGVPGLAPGALPVRDTAAAKPGATLPATGVPATAPVQRLPRGSLLDLRV